MGLGRIATGADMAGECFDIIVGNGLDGAILKPRKIINEKSDREAHFLLHEEEWNEQIGNRHPERRRAFDVVVDRRFRVAGFDLPYPPDANTRPLGQLLLRGSCMSSALLNSPAGQKFNLFQQLSITQLIVAQNGQIQDSLKCAHKLLCVTRQT